MGTKDEEKLDSFDRYEEQVEGYYEVIASVIKVRSDLNKKKPAITDPVFFNGEKIYCDGTYAEHDGFKYLKINDGIRSGYVLSTALMKL